MDYLALFVSFCAGIWNVLQDTSKLISRKVCAFMLGAIFCYGAVKIASSYGLSHEAAACVGYFLGVLSITIYDITVQCLHKIPVIFEKRMGGKHD